MNRQGRIEPIIPMGSNTVGSGSGKNTQPTVRFTSNVYGSLLLMADLLSFIVTVPVSVAIYSALRETPLVVRVQVFAFLLMLGSFILIRSSRHSYSRSLSDGKDEPLMLAFDAVLSSLIASALVWQSGQIVDLSRGITLIFLLSVSLALIASRAVLKRLVKRLTYGGRIQQRVVFYGADAEAVESSSRLLNLIDLQHIRVVGFVDDRGIARLADGIPFIGDLAQLCTLARAGEIDQVLISGSRFNRRRLLSILEELSQVSVDVSVIPGEAIELAPDYQVALLGHLPVLTLWKRPFRDINQLVKRVEDLVIASAALVFLAPLLAITTLLIRTTSKGPVLFVQPRIGFNNEVIEVFKFRTMYADQTDFAGKATTTRDDPRVTPLGKVLRKLSIDELPQLLNVLNGSMSLVGPRPHAIEMKVGDRYYHEAVRGYAGRHRVKPGITGLAQVRGLRGEVRTVERAKRRVELDRHYVDNWSLWLDLRILLETGRAVLFDSDAY
jgi:Undecaprenyl-phosphate glucose phosphotransferase